MTAIFDGVIILILVIALIVGFSRGFMKSIWGLLTIVAIAACIYLAAPPLTKVVVEKTSIDASISKPMEKLYGKIKGMDTLLFKSDANFDALSANGVPKALVDLMEKNMSGMVTEEGITAKALLANKTSEIIIMIGIGIVLVIIVGIIMLILKKMFVGVANIKVVKPLDRIFGIVYCLTITAVVLLAIGGIAYTLHDQTFMKAVNDAADGSTVFKYIYGENPLQVLFSKYTNIGKLLKK